MNLSLLAKWRWRLIKDGNPLWNKVLEDKYRSRIGGLADMAEVSWSQYISRWWKELMSLEEVGGSSCFKQG
jgi:hypothetical protein